MLRSIATRAGGKDAISRPAISIARGPDSRTTATPAGNGPEESANIVSCIRHAHKPHRRARQARWRRIPRFQPMRKDGGRLPAHPGVGRIAGTSLPGVDGVTPGSGSGDARLRNGKR